MGVEDAPSAMFLHCSRVYERMFDQSTRVVADGTTAMIVYEGMLTKLVTEDLGLPVPYYTKVRQFLMAMGCIRQLRRGGGSAPSQWELLREPTIDLWDDLSDEEPQSFGPSPIEQMIAMQGRRIMRLEKALGIVDVPLAKEDK